MKKLFLLLGLCLFCSGSFAVDNLNTDPNYANPNNTMPQNTDPNGLQNPNQATPGAYPFPKTLPDQTTPQDTTNNPYNQ